MKKSKKILIISLAVVVAYGILSFVGYCSYTGMYSAGNGSEYSVANTPENPDSPLKGKTVIFLGSSVTDAGSARGDGFVEFLAKVDGVIPVKEAVSGTTLVDNGEKSYIQRMLSNIPVDIHADAFVCQLSTNDASKGLPLGEVSDSMKLEDFDTSTITGSMEYIICYAKQTWNCPVLFYTGSHYDSENYDAMVKQLYLMQKKWDIGIIDLWNDEVFNDIDDETRKLYISQDGIHPLRAGYRDWWLPKFQEGLTEAICQ